MNPFGCRECDEMTSGRCPRHQPGVLIGGNVVGFVQPVDVCRALVEEIARETCMIGHEICDNVRCWPCRAARLVYPTPSWNVRAPEGL